MVALSLLAAVVSWHVAAEMPAKVQLEDVSFWDELYRESNLRGVQDFVHEWHAVNITSLHKVLALRMPQAARVLVLGCGDSRLPEELFDAGWSVTALDRSTVVIDAMIVRNQQMRPGIKWIAADATKLDMQIGAVDAVIEVGLLDSLEASGDDEAVGHVITEAHRVLVRNGMLVSISTQPPSFRSSFFDKNPAKGWGAVEVVGLPRAWTPDSRIIELDPEFAMSNLSLFVASVTAPELPLSEGMEKEISFTTPIPLASSGAQEGTNSDTPSLKTTPLETSDTQQETEMLSPTAPASLPSESGAQGEIASDVPPPSPQGGISSAQDSIGGDLPPVHVVPQGNDLPPPPPIPPVTLGAQEEGASDAPPDPSILPDTLNAQELPPTIPSEAAGAQQGISDDLPPAPPIPPPLDGELPPPPAIPQSDNDLPPPPALPENDFILQGASLEDLPPPPAIPQGMANTHQDVKSELAAEPELSSETANA